jgi:hypothetical protein
MPHYNVLFLWHWQLRAFDHGRGDHESQSAAKFHGL